MVKFLTKHQGIKPQPENLETINKIDPNKTRKREGNAQ